MKCLVTMFGVLVCITSLMADVIHVPAGQPTIQAGIDAAVHGDTVLVAEGIYLENINYHGKAITVASYFLLDSDTSHIAHTIIDGSQPSNPDSGSVVTFESDEDTTAVLSGFTITGGSGTVTQYNWRGQTYQARVGGGIHLYLAGGRISHNHIRNNDIPWYVESFGGGVGASQIGGNNTPYVIVEHNRITDNSITGTGCYGSGISLPNGRIVGNDIAYNSSSGSTAASAYTYGAVLCAADGDLTQSVLLKNNRISNNTAEGGNVYGAGLVLEWKINASIIGNDISNNGVPVALTSSIGGGITVNTISGGTIHIDSNTITGNRLESINSVGGGIALWANSAYNNDIRIVNNQISGNEAAFSGGIQCRWTRAEIINNTIISNTAGNSGGGMRVDTGAEIAVANTIFWNNSALTGPQIYLGGGTLAVAYSDVEGGWSGEGNIDADPLVEGDSLTNASPGIGAGSLEYDFGGGVVLHSPEFDINGRMRPYPAGTNPDMGARESKLGAPDAIELQPLAAFPRTTILQQNYPNPFNPGTTIEFALAKAGYVTLTIYNVAGEKVATLVSENLSAGSYKYNWDADGLASGVYLYKLKAGRFVQTRKMLLIR